MIVDSYLFSRRTRGVVSLYLLIHHLPCPAPPLTLENVFEAMKRAVKSWMWLVVFLGLDSKLDAITHQHDSEARLKAVIEAFLLGEGTYQPSWRRVIHVLHQTGESQVAHDIESYAEAMQGECEWVIIAMCALLKV